MTRIAGTVHEAPRKFIIVFCFIFGLTAPSGPGLPHSRGFWITHNDALQSAELLCTSDQLAVKTSDNTRHSQRRNIQATGGIRTYIFSR
jgi:hypothetical protein